MLNWLANVLGLCLFRRGPEDMPAAPGTLMIAAGAYAGVTFYALHTALAPAPAVLPAALQVLSLLAVTALLLNLTGHAARIPQTLNALFSTAVVFALAGRLPGLVSPDLSIHEIDWKEQPPPATLWFLLGLGVWSLLVDARIYQRALERGPGAGLFAALTVSFLQFAALAPWVAPR